MKQVIQSLKTGITKLAETPVPGVKAGQLLIKTTNTLVSSGTERMLVEFGKAGWVNKALQQPDKVKQVVDKINTDGLQPTIEAVLNKLDQPLALGYCNVGRVVEIGAGVTGFNIGDKVISNGKHAEVVSVPVNLCAKIPDGVTDEEAAFTVIGAIALQGIRLVQPTLGETIVVTGLGLVGLMTVQLLRAHGCRVLGLEFDRERLDLASKFGAEVVDLSEGEDPVAAAEMFSRGQGVDAVIVTASTKSSEPIHQAAMMCRKRGRIVLVGETGLDLSRDDFYKKELTFQVSASYGPGRYDPNYEEKGQDYPIGFVRWTEQRNFEAVLNLLDGKSLNVNQLISHRFEVSEAEKAYELVEETHQSLGILLTYPGFEISKASRTVNLNESGSSKLNEKASKISVSFVGSGNYATSTLIPAFKASGAYLQCVASSSGISGVHVGRKYNFEETTTDTDYLFSNSLSNTVVIATQHDSHARFVKQGLQSGKNIFVEKPLCLKLSELKEIETQYYALQKDHSSNPLLMVGFNRRFAPQVQKIKELLNSVSAPKSFVMTVNAGAISEEHWIQDPKIGGGRIIGEACHFIDLLLFLAGVPIEKYDRISMQSLSSDTVSLQLGFADGSIGTIHYLSNGNKAFPKERLEVFAGGQVLQLDNFRKLTGFGWPNFRKMNLWQQNKGQKNCVKTFVSAIEKRSPAPITFEEILEVSRISIELGEISV